MQTGFVFQMEVLIRKKALTLYVYIPGLWPTKNREMRKFIQISIQIQCFFFFPGTMKTSSAKSKYIDPCWWLDQCYEIYTLTVHSFLLPHRNL